MLNKAIRAAEVFPTRVGMNRPHASTASALASVPHARGDEPQDTLVNLVAALCSPRAWG